MSCKKLRAGTYGRYRQLPPYLPARAPRSRAHRKAQKKSFSLSTEQRKDENNGPYHISAAAAEKRVSQLSVKLCSPIALLLSVSVSVERFAHGFIHRNLRSSHSFTAN